MEIVCAIDLGTSRSGFAFSIGPEEVQIGFCGEKEPTVLLLDEHGSTLAFGRRALEMYFSSAGPAVPPAAPGADSGAGAGAAGGAAAGASAEARDVKMENFEGAAAVGEHSEWMLFERFKMSLHSLEEGHAVARNGIQMPLDDVFAATLDLLKNACLAQVSAMLGGRQVSPTECLWVLTVPAIWDEKAKQFMRRAAARAGLVDEVHSPRLLCCLEPEGACVAVHTEHLNGGIAMDERFLVLDCGGGTVDITAHVVEDSPRPFRVAGIRPPSGGPWGGTFVDAYFEQFLLELLGVSDLPGHVLASSLLQWEGQKCSFTGDTAKKVNLGDAFEFIQESKLNALGKTVNDLVNDYNRAHPELNPPLKMRGASNLVMPASLILGFFNPVIDQIEAHVLELLDTPELQDLKYVFLVGGFASSLVLQRRMLSALDVTGKRRLVIPPRPGVAVVHGAALVGRDPQIFTSRVSGFSYGIESTPKFDPSNPLHLDPRGDRAAHPGRVKHIFEAFVRAGDSIGVDEVVSRRRYPLTEAQSRVVIVVLSTPDQGIAFTRDPSVQRLTTVTLPVDRSVPLPDRGFDVKMKFGGSNIEIETVRVSDGLAASSSVEFGFLHDAASRLTGAPSAAGAGQKRERPAPGDRDRKVKLQR